MLNKRRFFLLLVAVSCAGLAWSQFRDQDPFNFLGFEGGRVSGGLPRGWNAPEAPKRNDYEISLDSMVLRSGKGSARIKYTGNGNPSDNLMNNLSRQIPVERHRGKALRLSGYVKTLSSETRQSNSTSKGGASLWILVLDGQGAPLA